MSRANLVAMTENELAHARAGTIELADEVHQIPAEHYYDPDRWQAEVQAVFRRMPLMLALTAEIPNPGDYKSLTVADVPVLITRDNDGDVRAFVNMCSHRGSILMPEGTGSAKRFTCPYHAWSYDQQGALIGVFQPNEFGAIDKSCYGLKALPTEERAGFVWVQLDPDSPLSIDAFLCGYDEVLAHFGFEDWHLFEHRILEGPNWKVAYDGYLDFYHLPILHRDSFGADMFCKANYYAWGPHQRVTAPTPELGALDDVPKEQWPDPVLLSGVWTIFPHISIAGFDGGGRGVMISQLFPGETADTSWTVQYYLMSEEPSGVERAAATEQFKFLEHVVRDEDYATGIRQGKALQSGMRDHVLFGRNEAGGQRFHRWVDALLETDDADLPALFERGVG